MLQHAGRHHLCRALFAEEKDRQAIITATFCSEDFLQTTDAQWQLTLDLNLFNVTALAKASATTRLPLRISYTGATAPQVPEPRASSTLLFVLSGW